MTRVTTYCVISLLLFVSGIPLTLARDTIQLNRYQRLDVSQSEQAQNLLSLVVEVEFPQSIHTLGDALEALLKPHGYTLDIDASQLLYQYVLFDLPFPESYRSLPPQPLHDVVRLMAGEAYTLRINPVYRKVGFVLKDDYLKYVRKEYALQARQKWRDQYKPELRCATKDTPSQKAMQTVKVRAGDTLTKIVHRLPLSGLTHDQQLAALFNANPLAFGNNNMNHLLMDAVLEIPLSKAAYTLSEDESTKLVAQHALAWAALKAQ